MIVINTIAGPGSGKSVLAVDLFSEMKKAGENVELCREYARIQVYEKRDNILNDQLYILSKQNRELERLKGQVDYAITDSPLLLGAVYSTPEYRRSHPSFIDFVVETYRTYENILMFTHRPPENTYKKVGRVQEYEDALRKDAELRIFLHKYSIPFHEVWHWKLPVTFKHVLGFRENEFVQNALAMTA